MIANHPASKAARACICAMATLLLAACASEPQTVSSQDSSIDFSRYRTYAFLADLAEDQAYYQSLDTTHLKESVSREMNARGFEQVSDDPDLVINFAVETQEKMRTRQVPTGGYGVGYDPFYDVYYDGWGASHTTQIDQFTEGKLNIDAIDVESRKLVWQGSTKGRITRKDEQNWQQTLDGAVIEIFTQFPVAAPTAP